MRESSLWFWHMISAVVILVLLGLHMGGMHLGAILSWFGVGSHDPVHSAEVFRRSQQVFFMVIYIALLATGLFHGLYGLRSILCELSLGKAFEKTVGVVCALGGVALFIYGSYVAVKLTQVTWAVAQTKVLQ